MYLHQFTHNFSRESRFWRHFVPYQVPWSKFLIKKTKIWPPCYAMPDFQCLWLIWIISLRAEMTKCMKIDWCEISTPLLFSILPPLCDWKSSSFQLYFSVSSYEIIFSLSLCPPLFFGFFRIPLFHSCLLYSLLCLSLLLFYLLICYKLKLEPLKYINRGKTYLSMVNGNWFTFHLKLIILVLFF